MIIRALTLMCMLMALVATPTGAEATEEGKVAVLNLQKLMRESKASKSIRDQIEQKRTSYQSEINKDEERLRTRDKELTEQRNLLSPEAFEQERREFKEEVTDVQRQVQQMRTTLDRAYGTSLAQVQVTISEIIEEMAAEKGFDLALPAGQTLFFSNTLDITESVLQRLDSRLPTVVVEVDLSAQPAQ